MGHFAYIIIRSMNNLVSFLKKS